MLAVVFAASDPVASAGREILAQRIAAAIDAGAVMLSMWLVIVMTMIISPLARRQAIA